MEKVVIFGNTNGVKSTLAKKLAELTGLPLYGEFANNSELLNKWIVDDLEKKFILGRLDAADTLIFIDLPLWYHYLDVIKRLLRRSNDCKKSLLPTYKNYLENTSKIVYHLKSKLDINMFLENVKIDYRHRT